MGGSREFLDDANLELQTSYAEYPPFCPPPLFRAKFVAPFKSALCSHDIRGRTALAFAPASLPLLLLCTSCLDGAFIYICKSIDYDSDEMENIIKAAKNYIILGYEHEKKRDFEEARKYYERAHIILDYLQDIALSDAERKERSDLSRKLRIKIKSLASVSDTLKMRSSAEYRDIEEGIKKDDLVEGKGKKELIIIEKPNVKWEDIGGLKETKERIKDAIIVPLKYPQYLEKYGVKPWKGVLLFGPPGCGKTLLAKAAATECDATFFEVPVSEISSKWFGESEKNLKDLFATARESSPSIIFFDEMDAISPPRDAGDSHDASRRIVNQLLREMDGMKENKKVMVLGATNYPEGIDNALLRPKRFDKRIYIPPPDFEARKAIFILNTRKMPLQEVDFNALAERTEGYTGADIYGICNEVGWRLMKEELKDGKQRYANTRDFLMVISETKPSIRKEDIERYKNWNEVYGVS